MNTKDRFIKHYKDGYMPWAHSKPDFNLVHLVTEWPISVGKALEIGCGTGTDAIWLAKKGFEVTAIDVSEIPISLAKEQARKESVEVDFRVLDFLIDGLPTNSFDFIFDRGYFHSYDSDKKRSVIAKKISRVLKENGLWLSLLGSCDSPPREKGPPMRSVKNIVDAVEPHLEILSIKSSIFGSDQENPAKNWVCLFKKRN